jgi:ADP-dependent NAD(P)H-hydrate dehydratase / NAD(P)H-hydrate epimerase
MILVTASQMRECDRHTIEDLGIPGVVLMELAGAGCANACKRFLGARHKPVSGANIAVVCGGGNNGGDGYVVARHLQNAGAQVTTFLLSDPASFKGDALLNYKILTKIGARLIDAYRPGTLSSALFELQKADLLVDAIFGTGLKRELTPEFVHVIKLLDSLSCPRVAVDIPSGIDSDTGAIRGAALRADVTVTFGYQKRGHWLYPGRDLSGELVLIDISIPPSVSLRLGALCRLLTEDEIKQCIPKRARTSYKNSFGHLLVVAGSAGMSGAALLSASTALRGGAGLVSIATSGRCQQVLEAKHPEIMVAATGDLNAAYLTQEDILQVKALSIGKTALVLGPGLGQEGSTAILSRRLIKEIPQPMLVDADGLNAASRDLSCLKEAQGLRVLTPHPKEFSRLCGLSIAEIEKDRAGHAERFAKEYNVVVVLKGADTVVASPKGEVFINSSGNPGLATAGSGDVLSGLIGSFLAQGLSPLDAARIGVYLHGAAGDEAKKLFGEAAMNASDVTHSIPTLLRRFEEQHA